MTWGRWLLLIAMLVGIGFLSVSQHNALMLRGYAIGERMHRVQVQETELAWLDARVDGLASPAHLAQLARARQLELVAWSMLAPTPSIAYAAVPDHLQGDDGKGVQRWTQRITSLASLSPSGVRKDDETSD